MLHDADVAALYREKAGTEQAPRVDMGDAQQRKENAVSKRDELIRDLEAYLRPLVGQEVLDKVHEAAGKIREAGPGLHLLRRGVQLLTGKE